MEPNGDVAARDPAGLMSHEQDGQLVGGGGWFWHFLLGSLNYTASENRPQHRAEPEPCRVCLVWLLLAVCWVVLLQAEVRDLRVVLSETSTWDRQQQSQNSKPLHTSCSYGH